MMHRVDVDNQEGHDDPRSRCPDACVPRDDVVPEALRRLVDETECEQDHELHYAAIDSLVAADAAGLYKLSREGADWLTEYGRPASAWSAVTGQHRPPLRAWQVEALDAWAAHGRHGVVEAVTGTGKSRVGMEATREAIADGYSVVIAVPTIDLIRQWEKTLSAHGIKSVGVLGQGQRSSFDTCSVVVGTVQSLYLSPPRRPDGRCCSSPTSATATGLGSGEESSTPYIAVGWD
jgi:hypothetical protein